MADYVADKRCPLCENQLPEVGCDDRSCYMFDCPRCGRFRISEEAMQIIEFSDRTRLSAATRWAWSMHRTEQDILKSNIESLPRNAPDDTDVETKARRFLEYIAKHTGPGKQLEVEHDRDWPVAAARDGYELHYLSLFLEEEKLISQNGTTTRGKFLVTPTGWHALRSTPGSDSHKAFVAMSFSTTSKTGVDLRTAYATGIEPGIQLAGYDATRIDVKEYNDDVIDEIIGEIRESRFVVADFTEHRNGVYFEAGFAKGLGLPVIFICHETDFEERHFDISHFNHIVWSTADDLRERLRKRIRATIGQGPLKVSVE